MSFESLSTIFSNKRDLVWQDEDVRFFVERYLNDRMGQGGVYCRVVDDELVVRVGSPLVFQEVSLWVHDLKKAVKDECDKELGLVRIEV